MNLEPITINGKTGVVAYLNSNFEMVEPLDAVMAKVVFDDGQRAFYEVTKQARILSAPLLLHAAADAEVPKFSVIARYAFAMGRKKLPDVTSAAKAVGSVLSDLLPKALLRAAVAGGRVASEEIRGAEFNSEGKWFPSFTVRAAANKPLAMKFDSTNPRIAKWARKHAAELVVDIAKTTLEQLRAVVATHADGALDDADFSKALRNAVGDEARAETIARTETMRAVHAGQREAWDQAVDDGLLDSTQKRVWIVTPDDKLCPQCEPYDGEEATLDGEYSDGVDGPPLHPNCRCTEGLQ